MVFLLLALQTALATADPSLRAELLTSGPVIERVAKPDDAETVIYYLGEQAGSLAPCGCADRPRGGIPRAAAYLHAASPGIVINTGSWLDQGQGIDGRARPDSALKNQWMVRGLQAMEIDAVHVTFSDLGGLGTVQEEASSLPLVSANLNGPGIQPFILLERGDRTIGITGISHPGHPNVDTPGFERTKPLSAALPIVEKLKDTTDVVILLVNGATDAAKKLAKSGHIDVVIDTDDHRTFETPFRVGNALWVRSHAQGLRLGELRIGPQQTWVLDRKIDLDDSIRDHPPLQTINKQAQSEIKALEKRVFGR